MIEHPFEPDGPGRPCARCGFARSDMRHDEWEPAASDDVRVAAQVLRATFGTGLGSYAPLSYRLDALADRLDREVASPGPGGSGGTGEGGAGHQGN